MRAEAPQRVLVGADLAEVQPVAVDVVDLLAELARVRQLLEPLHARVVLEQMADHQHPAACVGRRHRTLRVGHRLRQRLLHEAVLARLEHADGQFRVGRDRRGEGDRVERVVGQQLVEVGRHPDAGKPRRARLARLADASQHHVSSDPGIDSKLRARLGPQ